MSRIKKGPAKPLKLMSQFLNWQIPHITTSLHLRNEFALWIATILLTAASSHVLYKDSFLSTAGDIKFMLFVSLWLGRHFMLRLICTVTWVDNYDGKDKQNLGGGWRRRRAFQTWIHARERSTLFYHRIKWFLRVCSPYNVCVMVIKLIQSYAMAGQYCDASAANGVANAAMLSGGIGGVDDHYHHHSSKGSSQQLFAPFPHSNEGHVTVILTLASMWGTLCGLSYAIWALLRGEGGAISEIAGMLGLVIRRRIKSLTVFAGLSSADSEPDRVMSEFASSNVGGGGGNSKRYRRKHSQQNNASNDAHHLHRGSSITGSSDKKSSLNIVTGKLTFKLFPSAVRSQALHIQQMRTSDMYRTLEKVWDICPPAQLLTALTATILLVSGWLFSLGGYKWLTGNTAGTTGIEYESVDSNVPVFGGIYHKGNPIIDQFDYWKNQSPFPAPATFDNERPSWLSLILQVISLGTILSLFFYGRLLLPIPEFVAGTNVLKAIRAESRILASGGGTGKGFRQKGDRDRDLPWAEQYKSITAENRLRLYFKVALMRTIENTWLCVILPQTEFICRFTEHCEPGPLLWGPSGITGIAGRRFGKGGSMLTNSYDALMKDDSASAIIWVSTVLITLLVLTAQMTITNRTYLAIMGYISGEWSLVDDVDCTPDDYNPNSRSFLQFFMEGFGFTSSKSFRRSNSSLMQWDPKRRYQKGDRIAYDDRVYEAISNSPEGPPFDPFLRTAHDLFSDELGQPMTSYMISCLASSFIILSSNLLAFMAFWRNSGSNYQPIFLCLAASLCGGFSVTHSRERSLVEKILKEITTATN